MSFFKKLFGGSREKKVVVRAPSASVEEMRADPNLIRARDESGRELSITKDEWRRSILPRTLKEHWDEPNALYYTVLGALNQGLAEEVVDAAQRVKMIHPEPRAGVCVYAVALMETGRLKEAESELRLAIEQHGRKAEFLINLARVVGEKGDKLEERRLLWAALEADPNQENAVHSWAAVHREEEGDAGYREALLKIAQLKGSWFPQFLLARLALQAGHKDEALARYEEVVAKELKLPTKALMQLSGDLGMAGMAQELVDICEKLYDVDLHGLAVGNNLIKAHFDLGNTARAHKHLAALRRINRADWAETLALWENKLDKVAGK